MNKQTAFGRLIAMIVSAFVLVGCASTAHVTKGDQSRLYEPNIRVDKTLTPAAFDGTVGELYVYQVQYKKNDGSLVLFTDEQGQVTDTLRWTETSLSLPFLRQMALTLTPSIGVALINKRAAENVAKTAANCQGPCGAPTFNLYGGQGGTAVAQTRNDSATTVNTTVGGPCTAGCLKGD